MCLAEGMGYCFGGKNIPSLVDYVGTMSCGLMWGVLWTLGWLIPVSFWTCIVIFGLCGKNRERPMVFWAMRGDSIPGCL